MAFDDVAITELSYLLTAVMHDSDRIRCRSPETDFEHILIAPSFAPRHLTVVASFSDINLDLPRLDTL